MVDEGKIAERLKEIAPNGKINCSEARKLAAELKLDPGVLGEICNKLKIKVFGCELGCF